MLQDENLQSSLLIWWNHINTLKYKESTPEATAKCIEFRDLCLQLQSWLYNNTDVSRAQSIALTELETLNMWANKAIIFSNK